MLKKSGFTVSHHQQQQPSLGDFHIDQTGPTNFRLTRDEALLCEGSTHSFLCEVLLAELRRLAIDSQPQRTFIKGDSLRLASGRAVVCVGSEFSGQSFLVNKILNTKRTGMIWSRHFVVVNDHGKVEPFPCAEPNPEYIVPLLILKSTFFPGVNTEIRNISAGELVLQLLPLTMNSTAKISGALARISALAREATITLSGLRGEASSAMTSLERLDIWS